MKYLLSIGIALLSIGNINAQVNNNTFGQSFDQSFALTPARLITHLANNNNAGIVQLIGEVRYITNKWIIISTSATSNDYVIVLLQNFNVDQSVLNKRVMINGALSKTAFTQEISNKINQAQLTNPYTQNGFVMNASGLKIMD